jgi:hypothetical protein
MEDGAPLAPFGMIYSSENWGEKGLNDGKKRQRPNAQCSTPNVEVRVFVFLLYRVPGGIRTPNLLIRSQKLYPVELQALFAGVMGKTGLPEIQAQ